MGNYYRMRCVRVEEPERVWDTVSRTEERPPFGENNEQIRRGAAQNHVGSGKFELLVKQCVGNYDIKGRQMVFRFDSRRRVVRGGTSTGHSESSYRMGA